MQTSHAASPFSSIEGNCTGALTAGFKPVLDSGALVVVGEVLLAVTVDLAAELDRIFAAAAAFALSTVTKGSLGAHATR